MKKGQMRQLVLSLAAGIAVFLVLALALRWNFLLSAALGVGIYFAFWFLLAQKPDKFTLYFTDQQDAQEMQDLMAEAERDLSSLKASAEKITDVQTHSDAQALAKTGVRIYDYLSSHPEKIRSAHQFLTYTLDTAGKLLARYVEFRATGLATPEVQEILERTAKSLPVLHAAFERQFTRLMQGELLDVEADIELLRKMLAMEGEQP